VAIVGGIIILAVLASAVTAAPSKRLRASFHGKCHNTPKETGCALALTPGDENSNSKYAF
jgi:hypothetical protein